MTRNNPIAEFLETQGFLVLDGGLATTLEARGHDIGDDLWSAGMLLRAPDAIRQLHLDFLAAGADCITAASYQASIEGFRKRGLDKGEAIELLRLAVRLATDARDEYWGNERHRRGRLRPLVAASIGPYGAYLADGSEYEGRYDIDDRRLFDFHRQRWHVLAESEADILACETLPSQREARVLLELLGDTPLASAWMSFSCLDEVHLSDGTRFEDVVRACDVHERVAAIGINCTAPRFIASLIREARKATEKPVIVYPNSGERYDAVGKAWLPARGGIDWGRVAAEWKSLGASCIGGCCRVGPLEIAAIRRAIAP